MKSTEERLEDMVGQIMLEVLARLGAESAIRVGIPRERWLFIANGAYLSVHHGGRP